MTLFVPRGLWNRHRILTQRRGFSEKLSYDSETKRATSCDFDLARERESLAGSIGRCRYKFGHRIRVSVAMLVLKREYLLVCRMRKEEGDEKKTLHRMTKYFSLQRRPCLLCSHASLDLHLEGKQPQTATRSKKSRNEQEKEAVPRFSLTTGIAGGFLISKIK